MLIKKIEDRVADVLAAAGFDTVQNPEAPDLPRDPDLLVEGRYFDIKTPTGLPVKNFVTIHFAENISQSNGRFVVPIDPHLSSFTADDLVKRLTDEPVPGLQEIIIILPDGSLRQYLF